MKIHPQKIKNFPHATLYTQLGSANSIPHLTTAQQSTCAVVIGSLFSAQSCIRVTGSSGSGTSTLAKTIQSRIKNTRGATAPLVTVSTQNQTKPKSAHACLREILAHVSSTTNTNGHTYQGLLHMLHKLVLPYTLTVIILDVPTGLQDTRELTTLIRDLNTILSAVPNVSVLVVASQNVPLPQIAFTADIVLPEPTPTDLKQVVTEIIPRIPEDLSALVVGYAFKLHAHALGGTGNMFTTTSAIARQVRDSSPDITPTSIIQAFHTVTTQKIIELLDAVNPSLVNPSYTLSEIISTHLAQNASDWVPVNTVYSHLKNRSYKTPAIFHHTVGPSNERAYIAFTDVIRALIDAKLVYPHPTNPALITPNPLIATETLIDKLITAEPAHPPPSGVFQRAHHRPYTLNHLALLAALVKTEGITHPSQFPTHKSLYANYQMICAKLNVHPKPLRKLCYPVKSLKLTQSVTVHRNQAAQGRPNQLSHTLSPNQIAHLRAQIHAVIHPTSLSPANIIDLNNTLESMVRTAPSQHAVLTAIASLARKTAKNHFNAVDVYAIYAKSTNTPMTRHTFLATLKQLVKNALIVTTPAFIETPTQIFHLAPYQIEHPPP